MKYLVAGCVLLMLFLALPVHCLDQPARVSLIQLISEPEKLNGRLVTVGGYLVMGKGGGLTETVLYLHKEDADNLLDSSVSVIPNDQMRRDERELDRMYVVITGRFRVVSSGNGEYATAIREVQSCKLWSDPSHPKGAPSNGTRKWK